MAGGEYFFQGHVVHDGNVTVMSTVHKTAVATCSSDKTVAVWDWSLATTTATPQPQARLAQLFHGGSEPCVALTRHGTGSELTALSPETLASLSVVTTAPQVRSKGGGVLRAQCRCCCYTNDTAALQHGRRRLVPAVRYASAVCYLLCSVWSQATAAAHPNAANAVPVSAARSLLTHTLCTLWRCAYPTLSFTWVGVTLCDLCDSVAACCVGQVLLAECTQSAGRWPSGLHRHCRTAKHTCPACRM